MTAVRLSPEAFQRIHYDGIEAVAKVVDDEHEDGLRTKRRYFALPGGLPPGTYECAFCHGVRCPSCGHNGSITVEPAPTS